MPYLENRGLWPVWFAVLGHVVVGIAGLLLLGWRGVIEGWVVSGALLIGTLGLCVQEVRVDGRPGGWALSMSLLWAASVGLAVLAERTGIL